ncbi:hypothetical protein LCGC14_1859150 [marine sediment metagenome]|uniref:Uncharacterized protein n=1 Tax=marine sediment metagenome TaxID=412755 RepID=A0A0F9IMF6_9ZZZZ
MGINKEALIKSIIIGIAFILGITLTIIVSPLFT